MRVCGQGRPEPCLGSLQRSPRPLAEFKEHSSKGGKKGRGGERKDRGQRKKMRGGDAASYAKPSGTITLSRPSLAIRS